jgi:integral membrane sensor domain MASE1
VGIMAGWYVVGLRTWPQRLGDSQLANIGASAPPGFCTPDCDTIAIAADMQ